MIYCACCNSELTAPVLIDGHTYGYTCADNIKGGKLAKKYKLIPAKVLKDCVNNNGFKYAVIVETSEGRKRVAIDSSTMKPAFSLEQDGQLYIRVLR